MPALLRVLTSREVLTLSFGAMIGWSWVLLCGQWVSQAGTSGRRLPSCSAAWSSSSSACSMPNSRRPCRKSAASASYFWGSEKAGALIVLGGIAGILSSWNAFVLGGSRVMYALAKSGMLPAVFSRLHARFRTPYIAIIFIGVLSCVSPWLGRAVLNWLVNVGSFSLIIAYLMVSVAFLALRRNEPDMPRPFKVRHGTPVACACLIAFSILFLLFLPPSPSALAWPAEWIILMLWSGLGLATYLYQRKAMHA